MQFAEHLDHLRGQGDDLRALVLGIFRGDDPFTLFKVDVLPPGAEKLALPLECEQQNAQRL
jgi:hypothetical protein